jgi:hypothetical protein
MDGNKSLTISMKTLISLSQYTRAHRRMFSDACLLVNNCSEIILASDDQGMVRVWYVFKPKNKFG